MELRKKRAIKRIGDENLVARLLPELSVISPSVKFIIQLAGVAAAIVVLARPQFGSKLEEVEEGVRLLSSM